MNFPQTSSDIDYKFNSKLTSSKNSIGLDYFKSIPSNQLTINFSKDSNSSEIKKNHDNIKPKTLLAAYENEEKVEEAEEEEVNSDEYISSTMLDVDTNTYINMDNIKESEEKALNELNKKNNNLYTQGKIKIKENKNENENNNLNKILLNNIQLLTEEKESIINNNQNVNKINHLNNDNNNKKNNNKNSNSKENNKKKIHHKSNKSDFFIENKQESTNKEKKNYSNSLEKKTIFTPNNDSKKKLKILREMLIKKLDHCQNKNPFKINQSNTINIIENNDDNKNENEDKLNSIQNFIINKKIKIDLNMSNKNKKNIKTSRIAHNNSISIISNNLNKNISHKFNNQQNIQNNNNININIYNKNIINDLGSINIDDQKFHLIPQSTKKVKTQGRVGKIVYSNQNKRNNFIYVSNYSNNTNKNKDANSPSNKKNRISPPPNSINNIEFYNSISPNKDKKLEEHNYLKHSNIHSLKNLKSETLQKNFKKYLLEDDYLTIFPLSNIRNIFEKQKIKIVKDSKNKKNLSKKNNKNPDDIKNNVNFKIKKIIPSNINSYNKQIRSVNSCYAKKVNPNLLNNYPSEQILKTISNNNKKVDIYNNFKSNFKDIAQSKNDNGSNKRILNDKIKKNKELSFCGQDTNSLKNILSLKKIKNLKNKLMLQSPDYFFENNIEENNNHHLKKSKPMTTRMKIDLMTEGNKNNLINNNSKKYLTNNNGNNNIQMKNNTNSSAKRIIYINNSNYRNLNSKPFLFSSLSPNCQSIKQLMNKSKLSSIKDIYSNINYNNQGRNTYNIYASSRINHNSNNYNYNHDANKSNNINNKIFYKKINKTNIKNNNNSNKTKTINYNSESVYELPNPNMSAQHKKIILFNNINNVSNYNINTSNNAYSNMSNAKEDLNNNIYKKTIEILTPFSSINKMINNSHKKIIINKQNTHQYNHSKINSKDKKNNIGFLPQNIIYLDKHKIKNVRTFTGVNNSNKNLYSKNMMYRLNKNDNFNNSNYQNNNTSHYNYNVRLNNINNQNNNFYNFSNLNDKERNSTSNKSYGNLCLNKNKKEKNKEKNLILDIFEKNQKTYKKHISPIQEIKSKY